MSTSGVTNRRAFLKNTATGIGSLAVGMACSPLLGASNKTYRIGIIGSTGKGNYGHGLDVVWKGIPQAIVAAVADDNDTALASAVTRTGAKKGYADYRTMLDTEELDIVTVCPRWVDRHHEMLLQCAAHNCHVYMEKPFCRNLAEADDVVQAFEQPQLKLAIAHTNRYRPDLNIARRLIEDGEVGEILEVRARGKEDGRGGGEDLWVLGTHLLDLMRALMGDVESCYATVTVNGKPVTRADVYEGNEGIGPLAGDHIEASYRFKNGVAGYFASRRNQRGNPSRFGVKVFGSLGVIEFSSHNEFYILKNASWSTSRGDGQWLPISSYANSDEVQSKPQGNEAAVLDLMAAIETGRQPISNIYNARAATEMIAAVFESHRVGRPVTFPLQNRRNPLTML